MGPYDTKQKQTPRHRDTVQSHQTLGEGLIREAGLSYPVQSLVNPAALTSFIALLFYAFPSLLGQPRPLVLGE